MNRSNVPIAGSGLHRMLECNAPCCGYALGARKALLDRSLPPMPPEHSKGAKGVPSAGLSRSRLHPEVLFALMVVL